MKRTLILCVLVVLSYNVFGQTTSDSIIVKTISGGCKIYQGSKQLTLSQLAIAVQANDMAYQQVKKAQSNNTISSIIGGVGGFMIGYPLGTALGGGKPNWTMFGIGAGLVVISIPISNKCVKQVKSSVDIYNGGLSAKTQPTTDFNLGLSGNGLAITMTF